MRIYNYFTEQEARLSELEWALTRTVPEIWERILELEKERQEFLRATKRGKKSETK